MTPPSSGAPEQAPIGNYPFGQPLRRVLQVDRSPKRAFVLGVYASAVHARWLSPAGRTLVAALAVASEPYIFWRGDGVEDIIGRIVIPSCAGRLVPATAQLNGPSGQALDELSAAVHRDGAGWLRERVPRLGFETREGANQKVEE